MISDIVKTLYLWILKIVFSIVRVFPVRRKIVLMMTFPQNTQYIIEELIRRTKTPKIILIAPEDVVNKISQNSLSQINVVNLTNFSAFLLRAYHLSTGEKIIVDNYFPQLASIHFRNNVECIQVWHAAGAVKTFGFQDHSTELRSAISIERFKKVYSRFNRIVVGSDQMADIFEKAFEVSKDVFLRTGVPRTDLFFDEEKKQEIRIDFFTRYPECAGKKIVLYAPTFRDHPNHCSKMDLVRLQRELGDEYCVFTKLHPADRQLHFDWVQSLDRHGDVNEFLQVVDVLITDYSSIPFEFALLNKPMIFYTYDLEEYIQKRGIWPDYLTTMPGPVVKTMDALIVEVKASEKADYKAYNDHWNQYSKGNSSAQFVDYLLSEIR